MTRFNDTTTTRVLDKLLDLLAVLCSHEDNRALFSEGGLHAVLELAGITVMCVYVYLSVNGYIYLWIDGWMGRCMDRCMDGWMDRYRWMDGWMDGFID